MFRFKGHALFSKAEIQRYEAEEHYEAVPNTELFISKVTPKAEIYRLYLKVYDTALPEPWFDENRSLVDSMGGAVWCYDRQKLFGVAVFWQDIFELFGKEVAHAIDTGEIIYEEVAV